MRPRRHRTKPYDSEERTPGLAKEVIESVSISPKTMASIGIMKQIIRSSGSVGANYIEANEALSNKSFTMRVKICRKEAKESSYWLRLIQVRGEDAENRRQSLIRKATEPTRIFGSAIEKAKQVSSHLGLDIV